MAPSAKGRGCQALEESPGSRGVPWALGGAGSSCRQGVNTNGAKGRASQLYCSEIKKSDKGDNKCLHGGVFPS